MLLDYLREVPDHRRGQGRRYDLAGTLLVSILALLSGAASYRQLHTFAVIHLHRLREAFGLRWRKAPSYSRIRAILQGVDSAALEAAFRRYTAAIAADLADDCAYLACDGKELRGSFDRMEDRRAAQLLSVFATRSRLILAHAEISDKTNEIPAFQALVKALGLTGKLFTLDAMHAQKNLAGGERQRQRRTGAGQEKPKATAG